MRNDLNLSRRGFLAGLAGLGASAVVAGVYETTGLTESALASAAATERGGADVVVPERWNDGDVVEADLVIVGSGLAGLWAALTAAEQGVKSVAVIDKGAIGFSSISSLIAGASVFVLPGEDAEGVMGELVKVADYLSRQDIWQAMLGDSAQLYDDLANKIGVEYKGRRFCSDGNVFTKIQSGAVWNGIATGRGLISGLIDKLRGYDCVRYYSKTLVTQILKDGDKAAGVVGVNRTTGAALAIKAKAVILATGQCSFRGQHALMEVNTGDGYALAYDAGATINNMEFWAFDIDPADHGFEGGSLLPGWGARMVNRENHEFMWDADPVNGAGADVRYTTREMAKQVQAGKGPIYMDRTTLQYQLAGQFGWLGTIPDGTWRKINELRIKEVEYDVTQVPEVYYANSFGIIGAIKIGTDCATTVPGLFAASVAISADPGKTKGIESARAMWSGRTAARSAATFVTQAAAPKLADADVKKALSDAVQPLKDGESIEPDLRLTPNEVTRMLQEIIFDYRVSILPRESTLVEALQAVEDLKAQAQERMYASDPHELAKYYETRNMLHNATLHLKASLERRESRVCHYREDYPQTDNQNWLKWIEWHKGEDGQPVMELVDVPIAEYPIQPPAQPHNA